MARWAVLLVAAGALIVACNPSPSRTGAVPNGSPALPSSVTPVRGTSWLKHLGITMPDTRMGQMGGTGCAPSTAQREPDLAAQGGEESLHGALNQQFQLTGADLYRIDCRSCHGPDGRGSPPEINSLIGPVQATCPALIQSRMKAKGVPISEGMARQMAGQAEKAIRDRLQNGGTKMPAFSYLRPEEVTALLSYLDQLAGVPGKGQAVVVSEPAAHVGEQVVKGTCHICHDATGPGGGRMMTMMRGIIPSLASLPGDYSLGSVLNQVHYGTRMMMMGGNRMPPFPYLTAPEVAAANSYLRAYPPQQ